jgi:hypothetical protein
MRTYIITVILLSVLVAHTSCKKEKLADNPTLQLQGNWRLLYSNTANGLQESFAAGERILQFTGNKMLTYRHDTLLSKETFLMAFKSDKLPYLVADSDPWNPRIFSCTISSDTLSLLSVHNNSRIGNIYVRVK